MITLEDYMKRIADRLANIDKAEVIFPAALFVHEQQVDRLFERGQMPDGSQIGTYSEKEMWASRQQFKNTSAFKPQGKDVVFVVDKKGRKRRAAGSGKFANGNDRKSMYLADGYKELKQIQGYESSFVNLTYSSDLRNDFTTHLTPQGDDGSVEVIVSRQSAGKIAGLKEKYGSDLLGFSDNEKKEFAVESSKLMTKYLFGQ